MQVQSSEAPEASPYQTVGSSILAPSISHVRSTRRAAGCPRVTSGEAQPPSCLRQTQPLSAQSSLEGLTSHPAIEPRERYVVQPVLREGGPSTSSTRSLQSQRSARPMSRSVSGAILTDAGVARLRVQAGRGLQLHGRPAVSCPARASHTSLRL